MNWTSNLSSCTELIDESGFVRVEFFISMFSCTVMTLLVIFGNLLVVFAVACTKRLRTLTGYLILSLAIADLMVGVAVLPFSTINAVLDVWLFGEVWCQVWLVIDVWMCTASIYNLVAISIDRYIAITKPLLHSIILTPCRGRMLIASAWIFSFLICFPPMVAQWPAVFATDSATMLDIGCQCTPMNNSPAYILYSALGSFYLPMCAILYLYYQIYLTARTASMAMSKGFVSVPCKGAAAGLRIHVGGRVSSSGMMPEFRQDSRDSNVTLLAGVAAATVVAAAFSKDLQPNEDCYSAVCTSSPGPSVDMGVRRQGSLFSWHRKWPFSDRSASFVLPAGRSSTFGAAMRNLLRRKKKKPSVDSGDDGEMKEASVVMAPRPVKSSVADVSAAPRPPHSPLKNTKRTSFVSYHKKLSVEIRAAKTVAIVTGCFLCCWLGFCIIYTLKAFSFCRDGCIPGTLFSISFWLGYANSGINVFLYAVFNREFRAAFLRILQCDRFGFSIARSHTSV